MTKTVMTFTINGRSRVMFCAAVTLCNTSLNDQDVSSMLTAQLNGEQA